MKTLIVKMTEIISIIIAALCHFIFRFTIFFDEQKHNPMSLMGISTVFILASICMFLRNLSLFPDRFKRNSMFIVMEVLACFFVIELFTLVVWLRIGAFFEFVIKGALAAKKLNLYDEMGGDSLLGFFIISISIYFLIYTIQVTENTATIGKACAELIKKLQIKEFICQNSTNSRINRTRVLRKQSNKAY